jgi:Uma2 family endonuclease
MAMANPARKAHFSPEEYLAWEAGQLEKHEYVNGEVFAMAGAGEKHITVCLNVAMALRQHLKGSPCRTFMADMKVQANADNGFYYPDVVVTCSARDAQDPLVKREPSLLVEVLSPSTAAFDRGAKFGSYRQLASLQEYVLIDTDTRATDVYRKGADGLWVLHPFAGDEAVELVSVALTIPAAVLFDELDAPAAAVPTTPAEQPKL